jgi:methionyl-tRNA formyltransferase
MNAHKPPLIFMGTPPFAATIMTVLVEHGYTLSCVVTQPDLRQGRKQVLLPSAVKCVAQQYGIDVWQPDSLRTAESLTRLRTLAPQLIITAAYGKILPRTWLQTPAYGCINVHASLLPAYRGAAPIQRSILSDEVETGVTIIQMDEGMDTGDQLASVKVPLPPDAHTGDMMTALSHVGAKLLLDTLPRLFARELSPIPQRHAEATYAPKLTRQDEHIDFATPALALYNRLRALSPEPGVVTQWRGQPFKIRQALRPVHDQVPAEAPGTIIAIRPTEIDVATAAGVLTMTAVQPAGKKVMAVQTFLPGARLQCGEKLGE